MTIGKDDKSNISNKMLKSALVYATKLKWQVIPLHWIENGQCSCKGRTKNCKPGKHPLTYAGVKDATMDTVIIQSWWTKWPKANIGIACGVTSGIFTLDVDINEKEDGTETLRELFDKYGDFPTTPQQITGSGGTHYIFEYEPSIGNGVKFLPGLDLRSEGGYIIGSPSSHISSKEYEWEVSAHVLETTVQKAPDWLVHIINQSTGAKGKKKDSQHFISILQGIGEGARNHSTASLTGYLLNRNVDAGVAFEIIKIWNEVKCHPPQSEKEVENTFISILKADIDRRKGGVKIDGNGTSRTG